MSSRFAVVFCFLICVLTEISAKPAGRDSHKGKLSSHLKSSKVHQLLSSLPDHRIIAHPKILKEVTGNCNASAIAKGFSDIVFNTVYFGFAEVEDFRSLISDCRACGDQGDLRDKVECVADLVLGVDGIHIGGTLRTYFDQMVDSIADLASEFKKC